jgi:hypothetical protein
VFSQNGEDGVIFELCRRIRPNNVFVEFGVGRGSQANCVLLADVFGWSGLFIESEREKYAGLQAKYLSNQRVQTRCSMVNPEGINSIFDDANIPTEFGVLSIDIDGNDYWVWNALKDFRPALVILEYNSSLPDEVLVQPYDKPWDDTNFFGASLSAFEQLAAEKGYDLVHTDLAGVNAFFVRSDLVGDLPTGKSIARHGVNYYLMSSKLGFEASNRTEWQNPQASS